MSYLYAYLAVGLFVLTVVLGVHLLSRRQRVLRALLNAADPHRESLRYRVLVDYVVPTAAGLLVVVAWPLAVAMKVIEIRSPSKTGTKRKTAESQASTQFKVEREHLCERLDLATVEAREIVEDPLGAVPVEPFGHLHAAWRRFKEAIGPDDELWSFSAPWRASWQRETLSGYAPLRNKLPVAWVVIRTHPLVEDPRHVEK